MNCIEEIVNDAKVIETNNQLLVLIKRQVETELMLEKKFRDLCEEVSNFIKKIKDVVKEVERLSCKDVAKETIGLLRRGQKRELYKMTRLQMMVDESHLMRSIPFGSGSNSSVWPIVDNNGTVDTNGTMDNLEERIANLEMVFAYLKNKKMLERQENEPNIVIPSSDGTADEDIEELKVASKSKSSTSKPKKVTTHKVVTQKVQTKAFPAKSPIPIRNYILGLVAAHAWARNGNKTFGTRKPKDAIVAG
nr:hypothetical protein [Tanacetum cinerariifolium]